MRPTRRARSRCGTPISRAAWRSSSARRARAFVLSSAARATRPWRSRSAGKVGSLNVSVAAAVLLFERGASGHGARWLSRPSTSSTATTCCTRARSGSRRARRHARELRRRARRAGVVVFDGAGEERAIGPLQVRFTAHADDLLERLAAENRASELVCVVSSDHAVRWTSGQEVRKLALARLPRRARAGPARRTRAAGAGGRVGDRLDAETREQLERLRRGL